EVGEHDFAGSGMPGGRIGGGGDVVDPAGKDRRGDGRAEPAREVARLRRTEGEEAERRAGAETVLKKTEEGMAGGDEPGGGEGIGIEVHGPVEPRDSRGCGRARDPAGEERWIGHRDEKI